MWVLFKLKNKHVDIALSFGKFENVFQEHFFNLMSFLSALFVVVIAFFVKRHKSFPVILLLFNKLFHLFMSQPSREQ